MGFSDPRYPGAGAAQHRNGILLKNKVV